MAQIATGSPEVLTYLHTDHLGTPRYATNTAGASVWTWPSDAFGISIPTGTVTVNLRMPGQFYDSESGLYYNWNRYYNPNIGRYISTDPIGLEGGLNLFSYVGQSPIMASDILGLDPANDFFFGLMPAHTAQFMRNPIGGSVQTQLEYARQISQIRAFEASIALTAISANAPVSYIGSASRQMVLQCGSPDFIVSPGGTAYPIPKGSVGPIPT